ncbi:MAG: LytTR family transcriptional regulator [Paludibacteraceae bacterium]|nr:LytTR family transcriptional regulator [Paludibacteraceae bacterium]
MISFENRREGNLNVCFMFLAILVSEPAQWESLPGGDFVRIHRSYLVRRSAIIFVSSDSLQVGDTSLPISRKYREENRPK